MPTCQYCGFTHPWPEIVFSHQGICDENPQREVNLARDRALADTHRLYDEGRLTAVAVLTRVDAVDAVVEEWRKGFISKEELLARLEELGRRWAPAGAGRANS